jgi:geranylgeranyl pyrophosphate synthase
MKSQLPLIPLLEPIRAEIEDADQLTRETVAKAEEPLASMLLRLTDGGKRLRTALVVLGGRACDYHGASLLRLAAAVELLHTATLVHDDLVDGAATRRGRETLHVIWSAGEAVLAGDYLLAQSVSLVAELDNLRILGVFADTLATLSAGEIRQTLVARGRHLGREDYFRCIEAKTASMLAAASEMAAILAQATQVQIAALRRYGRELGMAFQIADDVLDFTGHEEHLGKAPGSDLRQGLITLPILHYLETVADDAPVRTVLDGQSDEAHVGAAVQAVLSSGAIEASLAEAREHARRSQESLAVLPVSDFRDILSSLADYAVDRAY